MAGVKTKKAGTTVTGRVHSPLYIKRTESAIGTRADSEEKIGHLLEGLYVQARHGLLLMPEQLAERSDPLFLDAWTNGR